MAHPEDKAEDGRLRADAQATDEETLDEFVTRAKADIDRFAANWLEHQTAPTAEHWPMQMGPADWDDQFLAYLGA